MSPPSELTPELTERDLRRDFLCILGIDQSNCGDGGRRLPEGISGTALDFGLDFTIEMIDNLGGD
jgi:hypothetical protein